MQKMFPRCTAIPLLPEVAFAAVMSAVGFDSQGFSARSLTSLLSANPTVLQAQLNHSTFHEDASDISLPCLFGSPGAVPGCTHHFELTIWSFTCSLSFCWVEVSYSGNSKFVLHDQPSDLFPGHHFLKLCHFLLGVPSANMVTCHR